MGRCVAAPVDRSPGASRGCPALTSGLAPPASVFSSRGICRAIVCGPSCASPADELPETRADACTSDEVVEVEPEVPEPADPVRPRELDGPLADDPSVPAAGVRCCQSATRSESDADAQGDCQSADPPDISSSLHDGYSYTVERAPASFS